MIETVSDFLASFKKYALSKIEKDDSDVKHTVAIGDNFEGLTAELVSKAIFKGFNLKMVERSFIYNDKGDLSDEMDCLLVVGDGQKMSFANRYKYHVKDVIAVFQVKKTLYSKDLYESHQNLRSVLDVSEGAEIEPFVSELHRTAYRSITLKQLPSRERMERFSEREYFIYDYVRKEALSPLRIVIGYYGFTTEYGLREGFVKKMTELTKSGPVLGFGPDSFPSLIICGDSTIIKNTGMPMAVPLTDKDFYFEILTSSSGRPMNNLLELVWTRLSFKFGISSSIFGNDFDTEAVHSFLSCREKRIDDEKMGWEFNYLQLSRKALAKPLVQIKWEPTKINKAEFILLDVLSKKGIIDIKHDQHFLKFLNDENLSLSTLTKRLLDSRIIYIDENQVGLLVNELLIVSSEEGFFAGENGNGRMTSYFQTRKKT
ncbi:MAG: hypothetical protein DI539_17890 [Flavobacterium psychrophilum]|nr:MAG: hypothetical protein DI539_17890 [Flavobacterium psychrophilum]